MNRSFPALLRPALASGPAVALALLACAPDTPDPGAAAANGVTTALPVSEAAQRITAEGILSDVSILSADSMEGRAPSTPGEERAVRHIANRFAEIGLEPVGDDYRLPIELLGMTKRLDRSTAELVGPSGPLPLVPEENFTYWSTAEEPVVELEDVPLLFVGYGVEAPEYGWDDFKGEDVEGKVLLVLNDDPPVMEDGEELFGGPIRTYYGRWTYKYEQAERHGAAGAVIIHTDESAGYGFSVIGNMGERRVWQRDYVLDFLAWMDSTRAEEVAEAMGTDLAGLFEMAARRDFRPVDTGFRVNAHIETAFERLRAPNVAGMVRGSDPELAEEYVVFTAHHDHLGMDPDLPGEDKVYSGALDNALGVAAILAAAEAFVATAPRRSVMFVTVTAEEGGLLGSGRFVEDPPVPRSSIVANFNVDSPQSYGMTHDVAAIGIDMNTLGEVFQEVVREHGLRPEGDPDPAAGSFYRSDQLSFAKAGIPALYLQAGRDYVEELDFDPAAHRAEHYHQVSDQISPEWDLSGVERDMRILFEVALRVADADEQPRWHPGNEFESAWRELYGR
jgi:Zn-dependent M28 family amino/carboxypeptidase